MVVVVMGSTGVGKSQLAIDIALSLEKGCAEIVNADSMQVYRGFPIATAKVSEQEKAGVPHHLLDVAAPTDLNFNVVQYCRLAIEAIEAIHGRGHLPIVVGGTHYYLEALLWENVLLHPLDVPAVPKHKQAAASLAAGEEEEEKQGGSAGKKESEAAAKLYDRLVQVDPLAAMWLHPHNERKVRRALEVFDTTGRRYSDALYQQGPPISRYDTLLLWLDCEPSVLHMRLDKRVERMIEAGLLEEVSELRRIFERGHLPMDYTKGILQAIGYKEFAPYFETVERCENEQEEALRACVAALKRRTRKYAKVQAGWINRHFRPRSTVFRLDSTRAEQRRWDEEVRLPAIQVLRQWISGGEAALDHHPSSGTSTEAVRYVDVLRPVSQDIEQREGTCGKRLREYDNPAPREGRGERNARWQRFVCEDCGGRVLQGTTQWQAHLSSRTHRKRRKRRQKCGPATPPKEEGSSNDRHVAIHGQQ